MYTKGQDIEVALTDAGELDRCFGRLPEGLGVFVRGPVAVGDVVSARITKIKKNYLEARLVAVRRPSALRVDPPCSHFGVCGGCKWQHVDYAEQLRLKAKLVADALFHLGAFKNAQVEPTRPAARTYGYRNKIDFSFGDRRYLLEEERNAETLAKPEDFALGFHAPERYDKVLDIDRCHIATPEMNRTLEVVKAFAFARRLSAYSTKTHEGLLRNLVLRQGFFTGEFMVHLVTSWHEAEAMQALTSELKGALGDRLTTFVNGLTQRLNAVAFADEQVVLHGPGVIRERLGDLQFTISPNSFFQTNSEQAVQLYETARTMADLRGSETVYDLYCGTGTIAQHVAGRCARVFGFEQDAGAVADARVNARQNGVGNCEFIETDLKHFAEAVSARALPRPEVVITDPPRAGMHERAVEQLRALAPLRVIYVSCNPASLARDGRLLCAGGLYSLGRVQPVDLFPHTHHVESVACFQRLTI